MPNAEDDMRQNREIFNSCNRQFPCCRKQTGVSRREFLKGAGAGVLALSSVGTLGHFVEAGEKNKSVVSEIVRTNPFVEKGKPILVVVEGDDAEKMIETGMNALGGLTRRLTGAKDILIKPNFLMNEPYPTTTDPDFAISLAKHCKTSGASKATICDSSQFSEAGHDTAFRFLKIYEKGREAGVSVVATDLENEKEFITVKRSGWQANREILIDRHLSNASFIINTPVLKRHVTSGLTCALKNHFGSVLGRHRWTAHRASRMGKEGLDFFMKSVSEFADAVRPELTIVDARSILVGMGPAQQMPGAKVIKGVNRMIFCGDMVATEVYCAAIMKQYDKSFISSMIGSTLDHAAKLGLGTADLTKIKVIELKI